MTRSRKAVLALATATVAVAAGVAVASAARAQDHTSNQHATQHGPAAGTVVGHATGESQQQVAKYWTQQRMRNATPD